MGNCPELIHPELNLNEQLDLLKIMLVLVDWKVVSDFRSGTGFQQEALSFAFESNVNNAIL